MNKKKKRMSMCLAAMLLATVPAAAQMTIDDVRIIHETDTVWNFGYEGINLFSRPIHRIDIAYPSLDPEGNPTELSGYVAIPADLYSGEQPVDGIVLYNHYTQLAFSHAPTRGYATGEDYVIANPLKPNYIVVCSDFYGFGITEGKGQWFCYGDANGQASIDCLLAARALLDERGISQGKFLINAGYSSGGYDALATQKVRDMKYRDQISFDKTVVGGMPFDIDAAYYDIILNKDSVEPQPFGMLMILDSYNKHAHLNLDLTSMMKEPLASNFEAWMNSGQYTTQAIKDSTAGKALSELLSEELLNYSSPVARQLRAAMKAVALENNWEPDPSQNYFVFHLLKDETVPVSSGRMFLNFLTSNDNGTGLFTKHIIPEKSHLQTNFVLNTSNHTVVGGIVYFLNLAAILTAMPVLYYDGELNTYYADLVKDVSLMNIIKKLEAAGIDVRKIVKERMGSDDDSGIGGIGGLFTLLNQLDEQLKPLGLTTAELLLMFDDSGITLLDILEVYDYINAEDDEADAARSAQPRLAQPMAGTPEYYMFFLEDWLKENNVNIYETK